MINIIIKKKFVFSIILSTITISNFAITNSIASQANNLVEVEDRSIYYNQTPKNQYNLLLNNNYQNIQDSNTNHNPKYEQPETSKIELSKVSDSNNLNLDNRNTEQEVLESEPKSEYSSEYPAEIKSSNNNSNAYESGDSISDSIVDSEQQELDGEQDLKQRLQELQNLPVATRVQRLESIIENQKTINLERKVRLLENELQSLRGFIEKQQYVFKKALDQQKLLYEDLDRRFSQVGSNNNVAYSKNNNILDNTEQNMYTDAYNSLKARDYDSSIVKFDNYLEKYPNGQYSASSYYWLGEIYMLKSDYDNALVSFDKLLYNFPKDLKAQDAMYKKAMAYLYKKDFEQAKTIFKKVVKQYKNTTASRLADKQLQSIEELSSINES